MWLLVAKLVPKCFSHLLLLLLWHVFFIILYYHYDPLVLFNFIHFLFSAETGKKFIKSWIVHKQKQPNSTKFQNGQRHEPKLQYYIYIDEY